MTDDEAFDALLRVPINDARAAAELFRRARTEGGWTRCMGHVLLQLQDDPEPLRAELKRIYVATEPYLAGR